MKECRSIKSDVVHFYANQAVSKLYCIKYNPNTVKIQKRLMTMKEPGVLPLSTVKLS